MARNWDTSIKTKIAIISASLVVSCLSSQVFASGFALLEQNVTNLGLAYSGTAALAEDASTGYFNPAGLTRLGESEVVLSGILINGDFDFSVSRATASFNPDPDIPIILTPFGPPFIIQGGHKDNPGTLSLVPTLHLSKRIDDRWIFGFNVTVPFGLNTHYEEDGIVRYMATDSMLQTLDFSPSIAYELSPCFAVGIGADAMWGKAILELKSGSGVAALDGFQKNRAHGWGYGWHAGILWTPMLSTRIGVTYRSHINFHAEGNSQNLVPIINGTASGFGPFENAYSLSRFRSDITFPETWTASLYHCINEQFALTADAAWTNWSRFHTLRLRFEPGRGLPLFVDGAPVGFTAGIDTDTWEHFQDSRRVALGLIYTYDSCWLFRIGTAYDQTPVRDEFRTARLPDEDRVWAAFGIAYTVNEAFRIDFGYAHLFFDDASINERAPFIAGSDTPVTAATIRGSYNSSADLVGIQIRYDFV